MPRKRTRSTKRSGFEDTLADQLDKAGAWYAYETERFRYTIQKTYTPDFVLPRSRILIEAKGYFTSADRSKTLAAREAIEEQGWELRFVFQKASNKLNKKSKTTYGDWCDKHGFLWAEGKVPRAWLKQS